ncbi:MAG TPA: acyl-CoA thioester hydrolase/BAAT C-terminal domain-containing protein [Acidimicrobiia bacterium]
MADRTAMRHEVDEGGLQGVLLRPEDGGPYPGVLVLGGSRGGVREELAASLAGHGLACLALAYFGAGRLPPAIVEIPLECVERAAHWLADHPAVTGLPVGVVGGSKGAELGLLAASRFPELIGPVVAIAPASVAFFGLDRQGDDPSAMARSSWSHRGRPVPFVPYPTGAQPVSSDAGLAVAPIYEAALANLEAVSAANIPVEQARGPILLVSGEDDRMWPAARMAEMIVARMAGHGRSADVTHLCYPGAGHRLLGAAAQQPAVGGERMPFDYGGTDEADAGARDDAWEQAAAFLRRHLV